MANSQTIFNGIAGAGIIAALVFAGIACRTTDGIKPPPVVVPGPGTNKDGGDSPVRVLGGSITNHSANANGWMSTGSPATTLTTMFTATASNMGAPSEILLSGDLSPAPTTSDLNLSSSWEIDIFDRDDTGNDGDPNGFKLCSDAACGQNVPLGKSVTATIMGSGNSHFYLAPSVVANGAYHFHRTEATTPTIDACAIGQCDFIGHIVVIVPTSQNGNGSYAYTTTSYKCQGDCGIGIIPH